MIAPIFSGSLTFGQTAKSAESGEPGRSVSSGGLAFAHAAGEYAGVKAYPTSCSASEVLQQKKGTVRRNEWNDLPLHFSGGGNRNDLKVAGQQPLDDEQALRR